MISIGDNITQTMSAEDAGAIEQLGINDSILLSQLADAEKDPSEDNVKKLLPLATTKSRGKASSALPPSFSSSSILKLAYP